MVLVGLGGFLRDSLGGNPGPDPDFTGGTVYPFCPPEWVGKDDSAEKRLGFPLGSVVDAVLT